MDNREAIEHGGTASAIEADANKEKRSLYLRYSLIVFFFYFTVGTVAYLSTYMQEQGLTATEIGTYFSIASIIAAVMLPVWGVISDRMGSARNTFVICIAIMAVGYFFVPVAGKIYIGAVLLSSVLIIISRAFTGPGNNLVVGWMVKESTLHRLNYSSVRVWGSIGFTLMLFALSLVIPKTGINLIFYITPVLGVILIISCFFVKEDRESKRKKTTFKELNLGRLFKNYYFMTYLIMIVAMVMYDSITIIYIPFLIKSVGADPSQTGLVIGLRSLLEMVIMLSVVFFKIKKRIPLPYLLLLAGLLFAAEHMLYFTVASMPDILLISLISGVASGLYLGLGPSYVFSIVPAELNSTAQTLWGSVQMVTSIIGSFVGGLMIDRVGEKSMLFGCGIVILCISLFFGLSLLIGRKIFRHTTPMSVYIPVEKLVE